MSRNFFQQLYYKDLDKVYRNFSGIIFDNVIDKLPDLQSYFTDTAKELGNGDKILISYHNPLWEPILSIASIIGLRRKTGIQNWVDDGDLKNILTLSGFGNIYTSKRLIGLSLITYAEKIKVKKKKVKDLSVSIIIPAKNEAGNIPKIIPSIPRFGKSQEIIFVEGHSSDNTWDVIIKQIVHAKAKIKYENFQIKALKQKGTGKADAAWLGLCQAEGDILIIYDADMTVPSTDLTKFYNAVVSNSHSFANGNRLLYPMDQDAMQTLNKIGNQLFSILFTWILGQRFKDTLCGTKAFWRNDFKKFNRSKTDPFGDFDLIFGAIRNNLKVVDIPVRYKERVYGRTNINRFYHGVLLIKMAFLAFIEFKLFPKRNTQ